MIALSQGRARSQGQQLGDAHCDFIFSWRLAHRAAAFVESALSVYTRADDLYQLLREDWVRQWHVWEEAWTWNGASAARENAWRMRRLPLAPLLMLGAGTTMWLGGSGKKHWHFMARNN